MTPVSGSVVGELRVRRYHRGDIAAISRLYYSTVHRVNVRDYGVDKVRAWAPRVFPDGFWLRRFRRYRVFVAVLDAELVGFVELAEGGEIDCFYVHHAFHRRGVGRALMVRVERQVRARGGTRMHADVGLTAEPFFRRMGFRVLRRQLRPYRNRMFRQALMQKLLR